DYRLSLRRGLHTPPTHTTLNVTNRYARSVSSCCRNSRRSRSTRLSACSPPKAGIKRQKLTFGQCLFGKAARSCWSERRSTAGGGPCREGGPISASRLSRSQRKKHTKRPDSPLRLRACLLSLINGSIHTLRSPGTHTRSSFNAKSRVVR